MAPLEWRYLARNSHVAVGSLEEAATRNQRVYPTSLAHPWRTRRAADPGFSKYYRDRYGVQESTPSGFFTSACSPLVYQDVTLPKSPGIFQSAFRDMAAVIRGEKDNDYPPAHELAVHEAILRSSGYEVD